MFLTTPTCTVIRLSSCRNLSPVRYLQYTYLFSLHYICPQTLPKTFYPKSYKLHRFPNPNSAIQFSSPLTQQKLTETQPKPYSAQNAPNPDDTSLPPLPLHASHLPIQTLPRSPHTYTYTSTNIHKYTFITIHIYIYTYIYIQQV